MLLGAHVSIAGGMTAMLGRMKELGIKTAQIFSRSPRGGKPKPFDPEDLKKYLRLREEEGIGPIIVHMPYVLNLSAPDEEAFRRAKEMLAEDLARCDQLQAEYLVVHGGSHRGKGEEFGLKRMAQAIVEVLVDYRGNCQILLENTAGSGQEIAYSFAHLRYLLDAIDHPSVHICFDTCHAFAAGYDLRAAPEIEKTLAELDRTIGLAQVKVIHTNDSKNPLHSRKDRHEHIGMGYIGEEGFRTLLHHPAFQNVPFILETPVDERGDFASNLAVLRRLAET
ncbi:MAG: deoxyribonuclease [Eubacteriales bacterium]|nr:deoxyribonuclease [Eubacteriales bacterium]